MSNKKRVNYGNWMPKKFLVIGGLVSIALLFGVVFVPVMWLRIVIGVFACLVLYMLFIAVRAYWYFSIKGKNLQGTVNNLVIEHLDWSGKGVCLDIGCGNGPVSIQLAKKYPNAQIIASDFWGKSAFEYGEEQCRINAELEQVTERMKFVFANAASLPFEDESVDAVVSNLAFHEVADFKMKEKHKSFLEAFRVLKKGGVFAVQDVFGSKVVYGDFDTLQKVLKEHVSELYYYDTVKELKLPGWLNTPIMIQGVGIFYGRK